MQGGPGTSDPSRISYTNLSLNNLISLAYDVGGDQVSGEPWLRTERYDLQATLPADATKEQSRVMLQNLLAERFHLSLHRIKKTFDGYDLVQAKSGSKLRPGNALETTVLAGTPLHQVRVRMANGIATVTANQVTMSRFAQDLAIQVGYLTGTNAQRVAEKTGLDGEFSFTLQCARLGPAASAGPAGDPAPSLFDALERQLGLHLEKTKLELDVLVIDSAQRRPIEN
jgi:uncharacterized protein (TIGR03435 family)